MGRINAEAIKRILCDTKDNGFVAVYKKIECEYQPEKNGEYFFKIMTRNEFELAEKEGVGFCANLREARQCHGIVKEERYFCKEKSECDEDIKGKIEKKEREIRRLKRKAQRSRYSKGGKISMPIYQKEQELCDVDYPIKECDIVIDITQRELIEAGINPKDLGWTPHTKVSIKDIIDAAKGKKLNIQDIKNIGAKPTTQKKDREKGEDNGRL